MTTNRPKAELRLKLDAAASPHRVEAAARIFKDALMAAAPDLPAASVTMTVSNRSMEARIRGWDAAAAEAVHSIGSTIDDPLEAIRTIPHAKRIASALARSAPSFREDGAVFLRGRGRKPMARLDDDFVRVMEAAAADTRAKPPRLQGRTEVRSPVLRVGRKSAGAPVRARIVITGNLHDVQVVMGAEGKFFDAAKDGGHYRITIHAEWDADQRGAYSPDMTKVVALDAERVGRLSGEEFLRQAPPLSQEAYADIMELLCEQREEPDEP